MASMTVPQRISDFLSQRQERMYCDTCIQERLGLKWRQQVQLITATLAVTPAFQREFNKCCTCEEIKQVTFTVGRKPQAGEPPRMLSTPKSSAEPRRKPLGASFAAAPVRQLDYAVTATSGVAVGSATAIALVVRSHDTN
jgi:hypothetical protein